MLKRISRNADLAKDLFASSSVNISTEKMGTKKTRRVVEEEIVESSIITKKSLFEKRLEREDFEYFSGNDWIKYFKMKFSEVTGRQYIITKNSNAIAKAKAMFNSISREYGFKTPKILIDFMFDCNQHIIPDKKKIHLFIFSGGFLNEVYQCAMDWKDGTYINPNNKITTSREWTDGTKINKKIWI